MKRIKKTLGIVSFCISLAFGTYALLFSDYPNTTVPNDIVTSCHFDFATV